MLNLPQEGTYTFIKWILNYTKSSKEMELENYKVLYVCQASSENYMQLNTCFIRQGESLSCL